jgi:hypothetical protein
VEDSCVRVLFRSGLSAFLLNSGEISKIFAVEDLYGVRVLFRSGLSACSLNGGEISKMFPVEDLYVRVLFRPGRCVVEVSLSAFSLNSISPNKLEHCGQHVCLTFVKAILRSYILSQQMTSGSLPTRRTSAKGVVPTGSRRPRQTNRGGAFIPIWNQQRQDILRRHVVFACLRVVVVVMKLLAQRVELDPGGPGRLPF